MSTALICPDCGGVIGATEATDDGYPCTCFKPEAAPRIHEYTTATSVPDMGAAAAETKPEAAKICIKCGQEVTHKPRVKDSRGYMCMICAKEDKDANGVQGVRCADCGRKVLESALSDYDGLRICPSCRNDRVAKAKHDRKFGTVGDSTYHAREKKQVLLYGGILLALGVLILLHHFHLIGSF